MTVSNAKATLHPGFIVHVHPGESANYLLEKISSFLKTHDSAPVLVSSTATSELRKWGEIATQTKLVPNIGRDISGFLSWLGNLDGLGTPVWAKVHSKRFHTGIANQENWGRKMIDFYTSPANWEIALRLFSSDAKLGMLARLDDIFGDTIVGNAHGNTEDMREFASQLGFQLGSNDSALIHTTFVAGFFFFSPRSSGRFSSPECAVEGIRNPPE